MHTYRVMTHVLKLGILTKHIREARLAFFAAYIHDMARKHDGYCTIHGADAANQKLNLYHDLFIENGASSSDLLTIGKAVTMHSAGHELSGTDPDWLTTALLKDADALDRIRLGNTDLDPSFLRFRETHDCIKSGRELYFRSIENGPYNLENLLKLSEEIWDLQ
jgi:hypothetical protein